MAEFFPETESDIESDQEIHEPPMYSVILINDDFTTMEFVVDILMTVFYKSVEQATKIMLNVHHHGKGLCGVYTHEVAETKVTLVHNLARDAGYPLKCVIEKE